MDNREDPGQYYPGGSVVPARPEPAAHPVESVNGHAGNVVLNASDVGALPDTTAIPTADTVSGWGFLRKTWANLTAAFASITHTHMKSNITDFAHGHSQSDVTGLTTALAGKQAELVSGTNIKTVNGQSLLGSGNVVIQSGTSAHASTHAAGGADEITPASIGALASNGTAANSLQLGGIDASEYAQVGDVPTVVAPSSSAAEDAAAGAKATGEALATLSASVPSVVSPSSSAAEGAAASAKATGEALAGKLNVDSNGRAVLEGSSGASLQIGNLENSPSAINIDAYGTITIKSLGSDDKTVLIQNKKGTLALTSDIKTKTSELTNDSGFVTASDIPVPTRVKNTGDTSRIDGDGNVYPVVNQYDGGTWTAVGTLSGTGTINLTFTNCTKVGNNYQWTNPDDSSMKLWVEPNGVLYWYYVRGGYRGISTGATNPNPFNGYSFGTRTDSTVTLKHTNTNRTPTEQEANAKLAREYPIKSLTVSSGAATALDSTINTITPTATTTIAPPDAKTIGARDWLVVVTQGATAYGVTFSGSYVADSSFSLPTMEANKVYVFSFTEISSNKFIVSVKEVADVSLQS